MGMISGDGNSAGAPPADDKKLAASANQGCNTEAMSRADDSAGVDTGPLLANGSRNQQASKTQQPASSKRRDYTGTDNDQGKTSDMTGLILSKPQQMQPVSPQTNARMQGSNTNQAFSLTNMHSGLHPQPGQPLPLQ